MKLRFQITDKSQTGFARYCPSFARAYECTVDKITELRVTKGVKKTLENLKCLEMDWAASKVLVFAVTKDIQTDAILSKLALLFKNQNKPARVYAGRVLLEIAQTEKNRARVIAIFANALDNENPDIIETALDALKALAEKDIDISAAISKIAEKLEHDWNTKIRSDAAQLLKIIAEKKTDADFTVAIPKLIKRIKDEDASSRDSAAAALVSIATNNEKYRVGILNALIDAANDPVTGVMRTAIMGLRVASEKMDTSIAIPVFAKALKHFYDEATSNATIALINITTRAQDPDNKIVIDFPDAIPYLIDRILDGGSPLKSGAIRLLHAAAETCGQETIRAIVVEMNGVTQSARFMRETEKNSKTFAMIVKDFANILDKIKTRELEMVQA